MPSKLMSIGTGTGTHPGEAHVWETIDVDGGSTQSQRVAVDLGLTLEMGNRVAILRPAILVLSHDDADHIGGFEGFKRGSGMKYLDEIWVPFEWCAVVSTLAGLNRLSATDVDLSDREDLSTVVDETIAELRQGAQDSGYLNEVEVEVEDGWWQQCDRAQASLAELQNKNKVLERIGDFLVCWGYPDNTDYSKGLPKQVASRALKRAERIIAIFTDASLNNVKIRLFSVDLAEDRTQSPWLSAGTPGVATIANAREVSAPRHQLLRHDVYSLAAVLSLTIQNRRALSTLLWHDGALTGSAIVWSDSSGEWLDECAPFAGSVIFSISTAPHHGSCTASHDRVWVELNAHLGRSQGALVCAGGHPSQNNCVRKEFLATPETRRACTRCRHVPGAAPKTVTLHVLCGVVTIDQPCASVAASRC